MLININAILNSRFFKNVLIVATGAMGAQIITMVFIPVITRLYGPDSFGVLGMFNSLANILLPVAALTYPIAIVLPESEDDAKGIARLSIYVSLTFSVAVLLLLLFGKEYLVKVLHLEVLDGLILYLPLAMMFGSLLQISQQWLIRKNAFSFSARMAVLHSAFINLVKTLGGLIAPFATSLVLIYVFGIALQAFLFGLGIKIRSGPNFNATINSKIESLRNIAFRYKEFPLYRAPQAFLNPISQGMPVLLLAAFYGTSSAGYYTLTKSVLSMPASLVGAAIGNVIYPRVAEAANNREPIAPLLIKGTLILAVISFLPFGMIVAFGPELFSYVFGDDWQPAGEYARWVGIWMFFGAINRPCSVAIPVLSLLPFILGFEIFSTALRIIGLAVGFYLFSSEVASIAVFCVVGALTNLFMILIAISKARLDDVKRAKLKVE